MWKEPEPDPGGYTQEAPSSAKPSQESLLDLRDQNEQQQLLIAQLKEMLRKEQSNVTQEKVEEYMNTLSKAKVKKNRAKREESGSFERGVGTSSSSSGKDVAKKQKLNLLKQQLEENKVRLAERGKSQKGIEEMVIQLKAQLNDSQQLIPPSLSIIEPKNLDYSKNSSQEELYNILLTKEKKITDLLSKVQKQEATILDLEENVKEKDSVIDARTKAITLMTDSLSKKGKSTLDALDDTKEQMRKMQENFVTLESEMKARQVKLLNDLKAKNLEIVELQDSNKKLLEEKLEMDKIIEEFRQERAANQTDDSKHNTNDLQKQLDETLAENNSNLLKVAELEKKLKESIEDLNRLKNTGMSVSTYQSNDEEVAKLKKQLEENNKNMIKVKAQSKAKIKELNKKLDQIKKASDANVLIVQLQTENTKLSEKIAELEEEKGNMQLKMVESSDSMKDSLQLEEIKELEHKLTRSLEELEEKDKIISLLESEIISLKEETTALNEKITNLSHLENSQVSSEIKSIQLEEQLEEVEKKSIKLREEIEHLRIQKEEMAEQIEELKKQNQEINMKLENYIQENMELMDKLEKLSAEKVSSAESIEIVEGLTQQEKLEFSAYQKNLEVHMEDEPIKCVEDDQIEPPPELNESVLQLSEDSTELLQKIDMFNMERKEVMIKMEALKDENNQLNMKLKEIENNRDILAETYEQLQTEKEELQSENDILVKKLQNIEHSQEEVKDDKSESVSLAKLQELQSDYEKLLAENEKLRCNLKEYDTQIHEKHSLEFELKEARDKVEELETKIRFNLEEVTNYQTVIDDNKNELINSANLINDLQTKLGEREKEIFDMNIIINDLNQVVNNLQMENNKLGNFEFMESQVAELKAALNKQIQQAQDYEEEIARNNDTITDLNTRLIDMNKKIIEAQHEVEVKDIEYKRLVEDLQEKDGIIVDLRSQLDENNSKVSSVIKDMKEKYLSLQKQLDGNSGSLEARITELTNKNKEQMDKMKKIAANLKKKSQAYQELEEKYATEKEKWEMEVNEKSSVILDAKDKMSSVVQQLNEIEEELNVKNLKLEQSEARIIELMEMIQNFEQSKMELLNTITELKHREQKLSEVSLKQELSTSLHEDFDNIPTNQDSANEEKIKELELIIETNENDIKHYNDRTCKLEEDVARLEQEKEELIQRTMELSEQLNITSKSVEEKSFVEEELGQKLLQVTANDEVLIKKLEEATEENRELLKKSKEIEEVNLKLKVKLKKAHERVTQLKSFQTNFEELENANNELKKQLAILETNQKHIQDENLELQKQNQNDYEKIEADYQAQLEELVGCRHQLTVECEKLREKLKEMEQREEDLLSEIAEYKQKLEEEEAISKEKMEELADEARVATFNWKDSQNEIKILKQQVANLETELINKIARETVESIVCEAEDRVKSMRTISSQTDHVGDKKVLDSSIREQVKEVQTAPSSGNQNEVQSETVPTFHWPEAQTLQQPIQSEDWFSTDAATVQHGSNDWFNRSEARMESNPFRVQSESHQLAASENSKEELLKKIKALEFLLYNIDKEKEEAFQECTRMVNELTRLVYEKVNSPNKEDKVTTHERVASQPVSDLESQIMSQVDITDATSNKKELQSIEFERTSPSLGEQSFPVVEEVMQPKRAYLTYQPEDKAIKPEVFGENDDGWGWGPEEAKLEEEHQFKTESDPQIQNLRSEIDRLNEALQVLQVERDNHLEEIKQLQIKSGKLIKKCKELKLKNDQLVERQHNKKSEGADFLDLDAAIEEELKMQIAQLEKKIKEVTNELEKEKQEKGNVLKRVEVLVSANDRMSDMKEIQDNEVLHWKRKYEEIEEKLQQYEWSSDGFNEGTKPKSRSDPEASSSQDDVRKIEELEQTIRDLALDNEELHLLLEEQRQIRINLEKVKTGSENAKMEEDQKKLLLLEDQVKALDQELKLKALEMEKVLHEKSSILTQNEMLQNTIQEKEEQFKNLEMKFKLISGRNEELEKLLEDNKMIKDSQENKKDRKTQEILSSKVKELETEISQLNDHKVYQDQLLKEKEIAFTQLMTSFEQVSMMREELDLQIKQLTNDLFQSKQQYDDLLSKNSKTTSELNEVINDREECVALRAELDDLNNELGLQKQINDQVKVDANFKINELAKNLEEQEQKYNQLYNEYTEKVTEVEKLSHQVQKEEQESSTNDPFQWAQEKYRLETLLADKESAYNELKIQKEDLEKQLESLRNTLDEKQKDYDQLLSEVDEKIAKTAKELEETWIVQVDQRGADIAESWKLHLESVEAEFSSVTEKMKYEISELEQKCSALMNENNELRRNVDVEIRNDVDRISALQQQITDLQQYVSELDNKLVEMQNENESLISELTAIKIEKDTLFNDAKEKESRLASLSIVVDTTQKQFDEKREVVEEIVRILEKNTSFPISFEKQDVLSEFQRQLNLVNMKEQEILDLTQSIENLRNQLGSIQEKEQEISRLRQVEEDLQNQVQLGLEKDNEIAKLKRLIEDLQKQLFLAHEKDEELMNMHKLVEDLQRQLQSVNEKDGEINRLKALVGELEAQLSFVQEKDGEIFRLNQIIENYKVQQEFSNKELDKLRLEHYTANMTIEEYKNKLEDFNAAYVILQNSLEEKNQLIATLNQQLQLTEGLKNDNNQDVEKLQEEISVIKKDCSVLQQSLAECQEQLFKVTNELTSTTSQLESVNQQLAYSQQNFEIQEGELNRLRDVLQAKEQEYNTSVENLKRWHLRDLENHYEELLSAKDLDIESIKSQLHESIENSNRLAENLGAEENLRRELQSKVKELEEKVVEQTALLDEEERQLTAVRSIIEQQVIKIEELKKELFNKSSDYDSLIAEMDIGRKAITQQPVSTAPVNQPVTSERVQPPEEDLSEPVSRAELDLALYMLHQRDVRCEELTVELTQLLEERDTLQLRLSNALREKEEIRKKLAGSEDVPASSTSTSNPSTPHSKSSAIFIAASGTELAAEPTEGSTEVQNLESKLSELKKIGYKKDKTFVDEQEFRRMQQMSIMQQHINEASKLPPEAAAKLVDASYTLSRDVQSPSKVLLNWLWGRSTPKVNDT